MYVAVGSEAIGIMVRRVGGPKKVLVGSKVGVE